MAIEIESFFLENRDVISIIIAIGIFILVTSISF